MMIKPPINHTHRNFLTPIDKLLSHLKPILGLVSHSLILIFFHTIAYGFAWSEVEVTPELSLRSRTICDWCYLGFDGVERRQITKRNLITVEDNINIVAYFITNGSFRFKYRFIEAKVGVVDNLTFGGDIFTLDHLNIGESYIWVGKDWVAQAKIGRQKFQLGHELVVGSNEWPVSQEFYDAFKGSIRISPIEIDVFFANLLDKSTWIFLPLKEQLLWQDYLSRKLGSVSMDTDLMVVAARYPFDTHDTPNWLQAYYVIEYFSTNSFAPFPEFTHLDVIGIAHHFAPLQWLVADGELAYQFGRYGSRSGSLATILYERLTLPLKARKMKIAPAIAFWMATGEGDSYVFVKPDFHRHLGIVDFFGLNNIYAFELGVQNQFEDFAVGHNFSVALNGYSFFIQNKNGALRDTKGEIIIQPASASSSDFLGSEVDLLLQYTYEVLEVGLVGGMFFPDSYAKQNLKRPSWNGNVALLVAAEIAVYFK